ncbi:MAG: hypothetical protein QQN58_01130 [Nitrosopumilus sp.]|nr:hypothetical protein [Nitrososphaerota archaeon]
MKIKKPIIILLSISLLFAGNLQPTSAQNLDALSDYSIKLAISPSHIEEGIADHHIGYIYVLSKNGVPITSSQDVSIKLISEHPEIASVPKNLILKANEEYATFDVTTGILIGETTIIATLNGKTTFQKIQVGNNDTHLPDNMTLELNLPTDEMHVNSEMPFSVYLKTFDDQVIRAPFDIDVFLDYEESLAFPDSEKLTITQGEYYAWGTLTTNDKVGNTFLRAIQNESNLDTAKSIRISSTLPTSLQIEIFPKVIPVEVDREIDIFVSVIDSDGNPTISTEDIKLKFFSNDQSSIGEKLDDTMKQVKTVIKKGEFGFYLRQELNLHNSPANNIVIGVSAEGYGIATDTFSTVGESLNIDSKKITERGVKIFALSKIPSNATTIVTYQIHAIETDDDDPEDLITSENEENADKIIYQIDDLEDGEFYPVLANENYYGNGYVQKLDIISGDNEKIIISDKGKIKSSYSFGTAIISSGQKSGQVLLSASIQGVGYDSVLTEVVNTLEQKEIMLFSPIGENSILFDLNGFFDVFLIAIDGNDRPKVLKSDSKYLVTPTNGLIEINKDSTFTFSRLHSDSFDVFEGETIDLTVIPIGENADLSMEITKTFITRPSSKISVILPLSNINADHVNNIGIAQIVDLQGNPIVPSFDVKSKIVSSEEKIIQIIDDAVIPSGISYETFPILTTGSIGQSTIFASAQGVIGTEIDLRTISSLNQLKIFTSGLGDQISVDQQIEIKLFVDDENAESVSGAYVKIITDENSLAIPDVIKTKSDGSAIFRLTAFEGPDISFEIIATAEGYAEGKDTFTVNVDTSQRMFNAIDLELPDWIIYIFIGGILMVGVVVFMFLKKSKTNLEEDWEDEEEI